MCAHEEIADLAHGTASPGSTSPVPRQREDRGMGIFDDDREADHTKTGRIIHVIPDKRYLL
jgi:hypothetical protein